MKRTIGALTDGMFDLLILGGGITGAGVALDAAARGFRVALIDKGDFASGTSSVSSKLVHGGLRYLEHGHFPLVYEALHERKTLLGNAPHLVRPLRFVIPFYQKARVSPWKWRTGLTLYDLLAGGSNLHRSRPLPADLLRKELPDLRTQGLEGGAAYFDAQMDDARLCLEVVKTAATHGAAVVNYVEAVRFDRRAGAIAGIRAVDRVGGGEMTIRSRLVLNAAGPWVDSICRLAGDETEPRLQPTKGVHLVAPDQGLKSALLLLHPRDGRVFFVIPWLGKTLIGTTDTNCQEPPDELSVNDDDISYLLEGYQHHFTRPLSRADLLNSYVGLRPLIRSRPGSPSSISREFQIFSSPSGLLSVAGGKYTTYRRMAERITDRVCQRLGRRIPCQTRELPLDGAPINRWPEFERGAVGDLVTAHGLPERSAKHLVSRYGKRVVDVAAYLRNRADLAQPIFEGEPDLKAELVYQREHEMALFPEDCLLRRTRLGLFHPELLTKDLFKDLTAT